jgi:hypothetical protein
VVNIPNNKDERHGTVIKLCIFNLNCPFLAVDNIFPNFQLTRERFYRAINRAKLIKPLAIKCEGVILVNFLLSDHPICYKTTKIQVV